MKRFALLVTLLALAIVPADVAAQEDEGSLVQAVAWEISPADAGKWVGAIEKIVSAAKQANLSRNYGWVFYQEDIFRYRLIYPVENLAYFDDPMQWIRQFQGTPGQATLDEAFQTLNAISSTTLSDQVIQKVRTWSREVPPGSAELPHAHVDEIWLKGGTEDQYDALMKEMIAFVNEIGYAYPIDGYRPRLGGTGQHFVVTFFDNRENFYGAKNLDRLVEQKGATERWQGMLARFSQLATRATHYDADFLPNMTYMPPPPASDEGSN